MAVFCDNEKLRKNLDKFPSSFNLELTNLTKERVTNTVNKLSEDRRNTTKLKIEDIQISNLLSYLYFLLDEYEQALQCIDESLQKDPDNITANTNKARILLETGEISEVEDVITKLQELEKREDYSKRECYARADLAYAYSRLGPWYHKKAIDLYNEVLVAYPKEYSWQFGLALTLQRRTHRFNSLADDRFNVQQQEETTLRVAELLLEVATKANNELLRAKAYAKLGRAVYEIKKGRYRDVPQEIKELDSKTYFEKAIEICPEEPSVLEICGQYARYRRELGKSEEFLRKSLKIKPTCHAYHHLALTLKRKVESGSDGSQSENNTDERRLASGRGQTCRDGHFTKKENRRAHRGRGRNTQAFDSNRGFNRYQSKERGNPRRNNRLQIVNYRRWHRDQQMGYSFHTPLDFFGNRYHAAVWYDYQYYDAEWYDGNASYGNEQMGYNIHTPLDCYRNHGHGWHGYAYSDAEWYDGNANYGNDSVFFNDGWNSGRRSGSHGRLGYTFEGRSRNRRSRGFYNQPKSARPQEPVPHRISDQDLRRVIKSPLVVRVYTGNESLIEAVKLLEKTETLDQYALGIQYEKGIIYRMLGQTENAVKVFKQIVSKSKYLPTKTLLANVYEQLGLCLLELSKSEEIPPDVKEKFRKDGETHLLHAVQIQSEIVRCDPQFKYAWNSYPTLKDLLSDARDKKPKQLAVLNMLMGDHKDSISIYEELLTEDGNMNREDYINMLECYRKDGQYEKCVTLLRFWECTTISSRLPQSLIFDVYIDGAFHAYTTDNVQLAYQHFRRAFQVYGMFNKTSEDKDEIDEEDSKDILILHSCSQKWKCKLPTNLETILEECTGLQCTINTDNLLGNAIVLESMASIIKRISCTIIMTHDSAEGYDKLYVNLAIKMSSEKSGAQILVVSDDKSNVPDIARTKPFILLPPSLEGAIHPNDKIPEDHRNWVKEFINLMKPN